MEMTGAGVEAVIREFDQHRFGRDLEERPLADADELFFGELLRGVVAERSEIDAQITGRLAEGWRLDRLDATVRAVLRCAVHELRGHYRTPAQIAIDEYVEVAKSFFGVGAETAFINGLLDRLARDDWAA